MFPVIDKKSEVILGYLNPIYVAKNRGKEIFYVPILKDKKVTYSNKDVLSTEEFEEEHNAVFAIDDYGWKIKIILLRGEEHLFDLYRSHVLFCPVEDKK